MEFEVLYKVRDKQVEGIMFFSVQNKAYDMFKDYTGSTYNEMLTGNMNGYFDGTHIFNVGFPFIHENELDDFHIKRAILKDEFLVYPINETKKHIIKEYAFGLLKGKYYQ